MSDTENEFCVAWRTNQAINMMILEAVTDEGMLCTLSKRGGRGVAGEFAHIHNIRYHQLENRAKDLAKGLSTFKQGEVPSREELKMALGQSGNAIEQFLMDLSNDVPKRRGFNRGLATTLSYLVAHEAHHRGRIFLTLKVCGQTIDKKVASRIWAWDRIDPV